ncbi:recombinase family protein [Paenibacillus sp. VCA1]|uniref:recombinase family protein n=1 Tax=Paenibacillus sp. VCA1 TaxID=3039148 RepID=UPI002872381B|nr:recombinase family protein [Paenibacillus sp. VCA1]MDR9856417.1 recombinase family protein [Paenibacillus sp. VCA1]
MALIKRVACLYRVSTKGQLDGNDIPMQQRACRGLIDKNDGWRLVKEYTEKGVSGFKVSAANRDVIQQAKEDAEKGVYDILLVFMFDRLGRRDDETPFVLEWFVKHGIEMWSVVEGQQKIEEYGDRLMNYLRFWQSSGESRKTSIRVNEKHTQMAEDGLYRGGTPPYGYKLIKSGMQNKKGKDLMKMVIDEEREPIVKCIFHLAKEEGYGSNRIAKLLNEKGITTATGSKWNTGSINFILRNPVYKGYPTYGKRKSDEGIFTTRDRSEWVAPKKQITSLVIIEEDYFDAVQSIRSKRSPKSVKNDEYIRMNTTKSPLLLVGIIKCGHCGSPMTTTYSQKTYKVADGTVKKWKKAKYRCSGKALAKIDCDGQTLYSNDKIENTVLNEVELYLQHLKKINYEDYAKDYNQEQYELMKKELNKKNRGLEKEYSEIDTLKKEIPKSISGQSPFKPELLNELIQEKERMIEALNAEIQKLHVDTNEKKNEIIALKEIAGSISAWSQKYKEATHDKKKVMLRTILEEIKVFKNHIDISFKLDVVQFLSDCGNGSVSELRRRENRWQR